MSRVISQNNFFFLWFYELKCFKQCPSEFKSVFYRRYVDVNFVLFESGEHLSNFYAYLNTEHPNILFSFEQEKKKAKLSFLDVETSRQPGKFVTTVYRKSSFGCVYTHIYSFLPSI